MNQIDTLTLLQAREELERLKPQAVAMAGLPEAVPALLLLNYIEAALDEADRLADMLGPRVAPMPWWQAFRLKKAGGARSR